MIPGISGSPVTFLFPGALLAGALLIVLYWRFMRAKNAWRTAIVICAALLLGYPSAVRLSRSLDLFVIVDRSRSISPEGQAKENELLEMVSGALQPGDRVSVISFNQRAYVEQAPSPGPALREFANPHGVDGSNVSDALATALSMAPSNRQARIFLLSDGEFTGSNPAQYSQAARQQNVPIYVRDLKRLDVQNLYVAGAEANEITRAGEPFRVLFRVNSSVDMPGRYRILRDGKIVNQDENSGWHTYDFKAGENRITFTDRVTVGGIHGYKIELETTPADREKITADNSAEKFVSVQGESTMLVVNNTGQPDNVSNVLTAAGIPVHVVAIGAYRMSINQLAGYKGVILNNVAITGLQKDQIDDIGEFVTQQGGGLVVAGGNRSFAKGGYYRSALEDVLPVSLEDRRQNKRVSAAFSFVLDRSGSMSMPVPSGGTKMDLADEAAVEALNLLGPGDSLSVIAVDSAAHIFVEQQPAEDAAAIGKQIRKIQSMGGGIFVYTGLVAAGSQIATAPQINKHVLLFADASDAEEPGDYKTLLDEFGRAGITVSVVGLGTENDIDAEFLKDVARRGKGDVYFTQDPQQLIQFFTADTIQHTRNNFIAEAAPMKILPPALSISPEQPWHDFTAAGYNLLFPRPGAEVAIATANADASPVLAFWQRGVGRAVSLALDSGGSFGQTEEFPDIVLSAARWAMGSNVHDTFQVKASNEGNLAHISMEVSDEERAAMVQPKLTMFAPDGSSKELPLRWDNWNRLSADMPLDAAGAWRGVIQVGDQFWRVPPVSMPVSPEFAWNGDTATGREALLAMASASGGEELVNIDPLFKRQLRAVATQPLVIPLLILMLLALLGDIAEARFGMLHRLKQKWAAWRTRRNAEGASGARGVDAGATAAGPATISAAGTAMSSVFRKTKSRKSKESSAAKQQPSGEGKQGPPRGDRSKASKPATSKPATTQAPAESMDYLTGVKARARKSMKDNKPKN